MASPGSVPSLCRSAPPTEVVEELLPRSALCMQVVTVRGGQEEDCANIDPGIFFSFSFCKMLPTMQEMTFFPGFIY